MTQTRPCMSRAEYEYGWKMPNCGAKLCVHFNFVSNETEHHSNDCSDGDVSGLWGANLYKYGVDVTLADSLCRS